MITLRAQDSSGLTAIGYGQTVQGEIKKAGADGVVGYVFPGSKDDLVTIQVTATGKNMTVEAILAHIVNKEAVKLADSSNGLIDGFQLPEDDAYLIIVYSKKGTGKYSLSLKNAAEQPEEPVGGGGDNASGLIVYASNAEGNWELYTVNPDGSDPQRLTSTGGDELSPSWSPDGSQIAYRYMENNTTSIYIMDADGSNSHKVTQGKYNDFYATWSPDGTKLAVSAGTQWNAGDIYVMNVDGSGRKLVAKTNNTAYSPIWSPDGKKILFTRIENGTTSIYTVNADGKQLAILVKNARDGNLSLDGTTLVFASDRTGNGDVYISKGGRLTQMTETDEIESRPMWSPDGDQIAFMQSGDGGNTWSIMVMDADGSNITEVAPPNSLDEFWASQQ